MRRTIQPEVWRAAVLATVLWTAFRLTEGAEGQSR